MQNDLHSPIFFCTFARSLWLNSLNFKGKNMNTGGKIVTSMVSVLLIGLGLFVFFKFFFVYSEGTNEGDINYFQREGFIFKTYEGKMIQTGYNSRNTSATIQSNEFKFSVEDNGMLLRHNRCPCIRKVRKQGGRLQ